MHLFILHYSIFESGVELQTVNRIHRIGQTKKTFVHKLIIKDSVEEDISHHLEENKQAHLGGQLQKKSNKDRERLSEAFAK
eukprot:Awhi_evm1s10448